MRAFIVVLQAFLGPEDHDTRVTNPMLFVSVVKEVILVIKILLADGAEEVVAALHVMLLQSVIGVEGLFVHEAWEVHCTEMIVQSILATKEPVAFLTVEVSLALDVVPLERLPRGKVEVAVVAEVVDCRIPLMLTKSSIVWKAFVATIAIGHGYGGMSERSRL